MGLDYVDIFYSHRPDPETPIEETMGALAHAPCSRARRCTPASRTTTRSRPAAAIAALAAEGVPLLIHQPRYNMFDRAPERACSTRCSTKSAPAASCSRRSPGHADRPVPLDGIPRTRAPPRAAGSPRTNIDETYLARVRGLNEIAEARGQSLAQLALTWVLRHPQVTSALIGASSVAQLDDSLRASNGAELTDDELAAIEPLAVDGTGR